MSKQIGEQASGTMSGHSQGKAVGQIIGTGLKMPEAVCAEPYTISDAMNMQSACAARILDSLDSLAARLNPILVFEEGINQANPEKPGNCELAYNVLVNLSQVELLEERLNRVLRAIRL